MEVRIDSLSFTFPSNWEVFKYDEWDFYKKQFQKDNIKAIDVLAIDERNLYLIEVKDYRRHKRRKSEILEDEFQLKVLHTLAALLPAKINALDDEKKFAAKALNCKKIFLYFYLEGLVFNSKKFSEGELRMNLQKKLRIKLKSIDPHVKVVNKDSRISWKST